MFFINATTYPLYGPFSREIYILVFHKELLFCNGSVVLVFVINCIYIFHIFYLYICIYIYIYIYILVFCFGDFFAAVSIYVVEMIAYYYCYIFQLKKLEQRIRFRKIAPCEIISINIPPEEG
jgi:hypothetical protein